MKQWRTEHGTWSRPTAAAIWGPRYLADSFFFPGVAAELRPIPHPIRTEQVQWVVLLTNLPGFTGNKISFGQTMSKVIFSLLLLLLFKGRANLCSLFRLLLLLAGRQGNPITAADIVMLYSYLFIFISIPPPPMSGQRRAGTMGPTLEPRRGRENDETCL